MTEPFYRQPTTRLRQGDIAKAEFLELRSVHDTNGPGDLVDEATPYFGEHHDFAINLSSDVTKPPKLFVRIWQGLVIVLHQACELQFASPNDSRLVVAPLVHEPPWPGHQWEVIRKNLSPGYFYLPRGSIPNKQSGRPDWEIPESAVALASACLIGKKMVDRRFATLVPGELMALQNAVSRFFTTRGYQELRDLDDLKGKRLVAIADTGQVIDGPTPLVKVFFGENHEEADEQDDEATFAYFGVRRSDSRARPAAVAVPGASGAGPESEQPSAKPATET